jgi:hypothetical protein
MRDPGGGEGVTDTDELVLPPWLRTAVLDTVPDAALLEQRGSVRTSWWKRTLAAHGAEHDVFEAGGDALPRSHVFAVAESAETPAGARRLLWATLAWGTGLRNRNNATHIASVMADDAHAEDLLAGAARASRTDPAHAYSLLRPRQNAIRGLGPPFFTKFLYFAGGGEPSHPCLILDSSVAECLRRHCGWTSLRRGPTYVWPTSTYERYCGLLHRWATELSEASSTLIGADQFERALFDGPDDR